MPPNMRKRIISEIAEVTGEKDPDEKDNGGKDTDMAVHVLDDANVYHLIGSILGPPDTPYEGGTFLLDIKLNDNHPFAPPNIKFITRVFHPNVSSQTGAICLDVLKSNWSPAMTLRITLISIQALLSCPDASSPQDFEVAKVYNSSKNEFDRKAKRWTQDFANVSLKDHIESDIKE